MYKQAYPTYEQRGIMAGLPVEPEPDVLDADDPPPGWVYGEGNHRKARSFAWRIFVKVHDHPDWMLASDRSVLTALLFWCQVKGTTKITMEYRDVAWLTTRTWGYEADWLAPVPPTTTQRALDRLVRDGLLAQVSKGKSSKGSKPSVARQGSGEAAVYRLAGGPTSSPRRRGRKVDLGRGLDDPSAKQWVAKDSKNPEVPRNLLSDPQRDRVEPTANHTVEPTANLTRFGVEPTATRPSAGNAVEAAANWLQGWLAGRPVRAGQVIKDGGDWGHSPSAIKRAAALINVAKSKPTYGLATQGNPPEKSVFWSLPTKEGASGDHE